MTVYQIQRLLFSLAGQGYVIDYCAHNGHGKVWKELMCVWIMLSHAAM